MVIDKPMTKVLIYGGKTGWIGGLMYDMCKEKGTSADISNRSDVSVIMILKKSSYDALYNYFTPSLSHVLLPTLPLTFHCRSKILLYSRH